MSVSEPSTPVAELVGPVTIEKVAHGGHCVARFDGRVIFVRHTLPGEVVMVRVTDTSHDHYWRADAVEVLESSPDRVQPPCPVSGTCGGCDFQHVSAPGQRALKEAVVREQLEHLAGVSLPADFQVEAADPDRPEQLLGWRTRMGYRMVDGHLALLAHRSRTPVTLPHDTCPISAPAPTGPYLVTAAGGGGTTGQKLDAVLADEGTVVLVDDATSGGGPVPVVHHEVGGVRYAVRADGFWQVHRAASSVLCQSVLEALRPRPGETAWDLYCGVGLFAGQLAAQGVRCTGVEQSAGAVRLARRDVPNAKFVVGAVERTVQRLRPADLVVLDPPRRGAGGKVCRAVAGSGARRVAYVACDPAALARDIGHLQHEGLRLVGLRAFDLFPMTHHVECVAVLER